MTEYGSELLRRQLAGASCVTLSFAVSRDYSTGIVPYSTRTGQ